jgi:hypothetical protein
MKPCDAQYSAACNANARKINDYITGTLFMHHFHDLLQLIVFLELRGQVHKNGALRPILNAHLQSHLPCTRHRDYGRTPSTITDRRGQQETGQ